MSLLQQLQNKKKNLKHATSVVTYADGKRLIENMQNGQYEIVPDGQTSGFVIDTKPDLVPAQIKSHLFLGSQDCCDLNILDKFNIKHILSIGVESFIKNPNLTYKYIECLDLPETNIRDILLNECIPFIDSALQKEENILVHCNAGCSRSPTFIIGYLIVQTRLDYVTAFDLVKSKRPQIQPNIGFITQLKRL